MMTTRNFDTPILGLDNSVIKIVDDKGSLILSDGKPKVLTIKDLVLNLLTTTLESDKNKDGAYRIKLIDLGLRIHEGGDREYTIEELTMIKERALSANVNHLHFFRLSEFLDPKEKNNG